MTNADIEGNFTVGESVVYVCRPGYTVTAGDVVHTCQSDETWSGEPPVCSSESVLI